MKIAIVSNGNVFSTCMVRPLFDDPGVEVAGVILVRVPAGPGGSAGRLSRLARHTGVRYTAYKALSLIVPAVASKLTGKAATLDALAQRHGVPAKPLTSANGQQALELLRDWSPDVLVSVSCPERLSDEVLGIAGTASINIHWALLPAYAGIAPYFWVLRNGEERTGLTVHVMAPEVDTGPVLRRRELAIDPADTALSLQLRLARAGAEELVAAVRQLPGSVAEAAAQTGERSYFTWPVPADVRALRARGRRLLRGKDLTALRHLATRG